jgi:hypothetical protein
LFIKTFKKILRAKNVLEEFSDTFFPDTSVDGPICKREREKNKFIQIIFRSKRTRGQSFE